MSVHSSSTNKFIDTERREKEFDKLIDQSFNEHLFNVDKIRPGVMIEGTVLSVTSEDIFLDIGVKAQGIIPLSEFATEKMPAQGDEIQAVVVRKNPDSVLLSYTKAKEYKTLDSLRNVVKNQMVEAVVKEVVNGGFVVEINKSIKGFVPISQMDIQHIDDGNAEQYINKTYEFIVQTLFKNRHLNPVLSRKQLLTSQLHIEREKFFLEKKVDDVVKGTVKTHTKFGIFIDLGGFDGLIHISDISWDRYIQPSNFPKVGTEVQAKIIKLDTETKKINLSLKAMKPSPWESVAQRYAAGTMVHGEIVKILPYGAFVHLEEGVEGFIHISEMSWTRRVNHPKEIVKLHTALDCKILTVDVEHQRISLGLKQTQANPWDTISETYPIGTVVTLPVKKIVRAGMFLEFQEGFTGFVPSTEYGWGKQHYPPPVKEGESSECKVIGYKPERNEITLSVRQVNENPFKQFVTNTVVEGTIASVTDFGVFVRLGEQVEAFMPKSLCYDNSEHASFDEVRPSFKPGENIQAIVKEVQEKTQRLILSIRDMKEQSSKQEMEKHMIDSSDDHSVVNLGDMLKQNTTAPEASQMVDKHETEVSDKSNKSTPE